jgi:hypothetical protein
MRCTIVAGADHRFLGRGRYAAESEHAGGGARGQHLIVRRLSGDLNDRALEGTDEGQRDDSRRRAGRDRPRPPSRTDEAGTALDETFGDPLEVASNGVILTAPM